MINHKKHDLRLFLAVFSIEPFIAFLFDEGKARFCTSDYHKPDYENVKDKFAHVSNTGLNIQSLDYTESSDIFEENTASKRTLKSYFKTLERLGFDQTQVIF